MARTLNCLHKEDWMCEECCRCTVCCACDIEEVNLVHVNSRAAQEAWRRTMGKGRVVAK